MDPFHDLSNADVLVFFYKAKAFEKYAEESGCEDFRQYAEVLRNFAREKIAPIEVDDDSAEELATTYGLRLIKVSPADPV